MLPWPQLCQKATYVDVLAQCAGQPKLLGSARSAAGPRANRRQSARVRSGGVPRRRLPRVAPGAAVATGRRTTDGPTARAARGALRQRGCACARRGADPGRKELPRRARSRRSVSLTAAPSHTEIARFAARLPRLLGRFCLSHFRVEARLPEWRRRRPMKSGRGA